MTPNTAKFVILYAEDDADDLYLVQECFAQYSHQVEILHAANGKEALRTLDRLHANGIQPCLIILDVNMPVMDGKQALTQIKNKPAYEDLPVVLFTTSSSNLDRDFAQKWGADFITKPLKISDIESLAWEFVKRCKKNILKRA